MGGGCRKNRRVKSLRLSTSDVAHSRSFGAFSSKGVTSVESRSSSMTSDGSHIDLALVYANFMNPHQPPPSKSTATTTTTATSSTGFEMQELGTGEFDQPLDFPTIPNSNLESSSVQLHGSLDGCLTTISGSYMEAPSDDNNNHQLMCYYGADSSTHNHQAHDNNVQQCLGTHHESNHNGLPPLPGEEVGPHHEILWSNSHLMGNDHTLQVTQDPPILGPETQDPNNLLFGNWNPFDLSSDHDTFSGP